ncbi:type I polyketide synthase [Paenibacillus apiarius]|uniref:Type I polyketide synthase n=1 Tax=Paenibacillus apiarius TaxID=46240 RepID=A0ABT4DPT0_9BACL|nr:type I polyketide synthase [Paenibacillus apiarius]MCY9513732.1 type I polyketide synthase [Paenibacillus apiarius]MCY9518283.1 type I polyketide synthase [Paenibacillus apiarius]MCY9551316.1 type I polyketide synthase [Paenibacillus apiarius]MCY9558470.1 type I polyketide synthase [Paenibacillus apiarius]MCY9684216.1 type I polyketide synthase [Paenibacillus apiarius]
MSGSNGREYTGSEIAVIGMSGRFPGAKNLREYWDNLRNGKESISFFSDEELLEAGIDPEVVRHPNYVKAKGMLDDIEYFDPEFFDYTPREAEVMDPQFRLLHECSWEALEQAGYDPKTYRGAIGLYTGAAFNSHWFMRAFKGLGTAEESATLETAMLNLRDYMATLVSYKLNLKGPSFTVQTACSTSLVAVHLACQGLLSGECGMALAGGVSIQLPQKNGYFYQEGMINSPDGHCRAFDERAAGTVFGDGAGIVVLKPLEDALADGDHIFAVIKGSAINNDGNRKVGYTAPSTSGQVSVIRAAHHVSEVEPESISYIEAHGTGTTLGDPIEIEALKTAFQTEKKRYCGIGSAKSNIGHLNNAAGVAGFIKTVLALAHKQLPPTLHYERPNPKIDFANSPFYVNDRLRDWTNDSYPLRAGVSSFGIGGTNAHVVLEEAPPAPASSPGRTAQLIALSAKTEASLDRLTERMARHLQERPDISLADMAYTLQVGRASFPHRRTFVCGSAEEAAARLAQLGSADVQSGIAAADDKPVVFMFSGQGSQYVGMGRELYEREPVFRDEANRCFEQMPDEVGREVKRVLYPSAEDPEAAGALINRTDIAQPVIFTVEYALAKLMMKWGLDPQAMIGHSIGEYVAACIAGVFSLEDAIRLVTLRGQLMQSLPGGVMLSVPLTEEELLPLLPSGLSLAAVNAPSMCVVSGPHEEVEALAASLEERGHGCRRLHTSHAFHSAMMEPILEEYEREVGKLVLNPPSKPFISNVTGTWIRDEEAVSPAYWARHLRSTVRFADGLTTLFTELDAAFAEIGGGNALTAFARWHADATEERVFANLMRHPQQNSSDVAHLLLQIGRLWNAGVKIDWTRFYGEEKRNRIPLPTYPFDRRRFWIDEEGIRIVHSGSATESAGESGGMERHARPELPSGLAASRNPLEETLLHIWRNLFGIEEIGVHDDFFELGGHSLKATSLITKIHKELDSELALSDIFNMPTISELARHIRQMEKNEYLAIAPAERKPYYQLSSAQKRTFLIHQQIGEVTTYNMPMALLVHGKADTERFEEAFVKLIQRHENMRTSFHMVDGEPMQRIHESFAFAIERLEADEQDMKKIVRRFIKPFDLGQAPLIRAAFVKLAPEKHVLLMDMHNIVSDGASMNVFIKEFSDLYAGKDIPPLRIQYKDYAEWQHRLLGGDVIRKQEQYWMNQFRQDIPVLNMPTDFERPEFQSFVGRAHKLNLSKETADRLNALAKSQNVTINVLLFHLYTIVLYNYTGQHDMTVGSLVAGRRHADVEPLIGMFTNFLPIRVCLEERRTILDQLRTLNDTMMNAYENQDFPFDRMVEKLSAKLPRGRNPLFDTMMIFHNEFDGDTVLTAEGLTFENYDITKGISKLDFKLDIGYADNGGLLCVMQYNTALFAEETMAGLMRHFTELIDFVLADPDRELGSIELFTEAKRRELAAKRRNPASERVFAVTAASTFTADPIRPYVSWWGQQFGTRIDVRFAPYHQVFQELLNPDSSLSSDGDAGLLLVRFEDWLRDDRSPEAERIKKLERALGDLVQALSAGRSARPLFAGVFPVSASLAASPVMASYLEELTNRWKRELERLEHVHVIDFREVGAMFGVEQIYDAAADQAAHMPFTPEYYAAIGTFTARRLLAWQGHPFKVIAVDCDNTLWHGVCGEDGAEGVTVGEPYRELQRYLLTKQQEGMLLVLVSKNNDTDVWNVFDNHPDMLLKKEHLAGWRINWSSKSENLQSLAEELRLGLDSFVFIDDSSLECSEVQSNCPDVLTLQQPGERQLPAFLQHVWALDRIRVTEDDKRRTEMYATERKRGEIRASASSLQAFLDELELMMSLNEARAGQLPRIAQLMQRTNQFTLHADRSTESGLAAILAEPDTACWAIEAADRFGRYGLVGAVITRCERGILHLDAFLLSCRILGRGIEAAVLSSLKPYCRERQADYIEAVCTLTGKNEPMLAFLKAGKWIVMEETERTVRFRHAVEDIPDTIGHIQCVCNAPLPGNEEPQRAENERHHTANIVTAAERSFEQPAWEAVVRGRENQTHRHQLLPLQYYNASRLLQLPVQEIEEGAALRSAYRAPTNEVEAALVQIWEQVLGIGSIGIDDDFFRLGGSSLHAVRVEIEMEKQGLFTDGQQLFKYRTIHQLSPFIRVSVMD